MTATVIRYNFTPRVRFAIKLDAPCAEVIRFPNLRRRIEIQRLDEELAGITLRVRGLEAQGQQLERTRDQLEALVVRLERRER